jgi:hypothetical protein
MTKKNSAGQKLAALGLLGASVGGAFAAGLLSLNHLKTGNACPTAGAIPLCYLIFAGYGLILLGAVTRSTIVFWSGMAPVLGLALIGASMELAVGDICPRTANGVPQCFLSLGLATLILLLWFIVNQRQK